MFFRTKQSGDRAYLQIVESFRQAGKPRQRVIATLGRLDALAASGQLESLLASGARFAEGAMVLNAFENGDLTAVTTQRIGPALIFERLWEETGFPPFLRYNLTIAKEGPVAWSKAGKQESQVLKQKSCGTIFGLGLGQRNSRQTKLH